MASTGGRVACSLACPRCGQSGCRGTQKCGDWASHGQGEIYVRDQFANCVIQERLWKEFPAVPALAVCKELPGVLMNLPQEINDQDGRDPTFQHAFMLDKPVPDLHNRGEVWALRFEHHLQ